MAPVTALYSDETLQACEQAANCEVNRGPVGFSTIGLSRVKSRAQPSMPHVSIVPPLARWSRSKPQLVRRAETETNVEMGKNTMNWGSAKPEQVLDALNDLCGKISCDSAGGKVKTKVASSTRGVEKELVLTPQGQYDDDEEIKSHFIDALKALAAEGQKWETKSYYVNNNWAPSAGQQDECTQSTHFSVNRYVEVEGKKLLQGFMTWRSHCRTRRILYASVLWKRRHWRHERRLEILLHLSHTVWFVRESLSMALAQIL